MLQAKVHVSAAASPAPVRGHGIIHAHLVAKHSVVTVLVAAHVICTKTTRIAASPLYKSVSSINKHFLFTNLLNGQTGIFI